MEIKTSKEEKATVLTITGRMDAATAPEYEKNLNQLIEGGEKNFVADFEGLDYISSAGLRAMLATAKLLKTKGGKISLINVKGTVKDVLEMSGFSSIFKIHESLALALADIA